MIKFNKTCQIHPTRLLCFIKQNQQEASEDGNAGLSQFDLEAQQYHGQGHSYMYHINQ